MSQGEPQPAQQSEAVTVVPPSPIPVIGDDQWNKDIAGILTSNANNAIAELGFNPNVLRALKAADSDIARLKAEKKILESKSRDLSAHLALANNRIDFAKLDTHAQWKEIAYYREKYHSLQRQHQEVLRAHSTCAAGPPEQPYGHLLQELERLQDMYRHTLGQNATLKFEVQRLMQQCVNAGLIPPPQNYNVTPLPALQPPARRVSEPAIASYPQQTQHTQGAQPGPAMRQFASPPLNGYAPNRPAASSPMIVAGPAQAYSYHRAQFPQSQQAPAQLMPPPPQQPQHTFSQQQLPAVRPRQAIDLTDSDDERAPKRPRIASDPEVSTQHSPGPSNRPQHPAWAQTPYQIPQQRTPQPRPQMVPVDHTQNPPMQPNYQQRSVTTPTDTYQRAPPPTSPPFGANSHPNVPTPPTSAPPIMDAYRVVTGEWSAIQTQSQPPNAHGQMREVGQSRQVHPSPRHPAKVGAQIPSTADAGISVATVASPVETSAGRSTATPLASTPAAPPPDSAPVSPDAVDGRTQGGETSIPPLTEEQTKEMHSELADSMFTEPKEDDETQARVCRFCHHRRELGILTVPLQPLLKPTTEEMYLHLQAEHSESLKIEERDWKMELFGMDPLNNQQQ